MSRYVIWGVDCDGPGRIMYAPVCDTVEEAEAWIADFEDDEIRDIWIEEEQPLYHEVYGQYEGDN
jgi:hypothetical protein